MPCTRSSEQAVFNKAPSGQRRLTFKALLCAGFSPAGAQVCFQMSLQKPVYTCASLPCLPAHSLWQYSSYSLPQVQRAATMLTPLRQQLVHCTLFTSLPE
jgi:hypothetical protein